MPDGRWSGLARDLRGVPARAGHELFAALNYVCVAQLYLRDNVLMERTLDADDIKPLPAGHWGSCPPVNWCLAQIASLRSVASRAADVEVVHGGGHAGPSALSAAWLSGALARRYPHLCRDRHGLRRLVADFPMAVPAGGEITPAIPGIRWMGGELGPALAFAQGRALDQPDRIVVALLGDGECETGATSAAWLGARALRDSGSRGCVLPVVLLNGMRMGSRSLLAGLIDDELRRHFIGVGCCMLTVDPLADDAAAREAFAEAIGMLEPVGREGQPVVVLRLAKGATGPDAVQGCRIEGTAHVHKAPLRSPHTDPDEREQLDAWLRSYQPVELFDAEGRPRPRFVRHLSNESQLDRPRRAVRIGSRGSLSQEVAAGRVRVFSPDELWSNRVPLVDERGSLSPYVVEILNEHLCDAWARGVASTPDRAAIVISYEAFAPLLASQISQALKADDMARAVGELRGAPVHVFTSLCWRNSFTHRNTLLTDTLLVNERPWVRLHFPVEAPERTIVACLDDDDHHFVWYDKHLAGTAAPVALDKRLPGALAARRGDGPPDLLLISIGDRMTRYADQAAEHLAADRDVSIAHVALTELTSARRHWSTILDTIAVDPEHAFPALLVGTPSTSGLRGFLSLLEPALPTLVRGYDESGRWLEPVELERHCRCDPRSLVEDARELVTAHRVVRPI